MELCKVTQDGAQLTFTNVELVILQNALNEVCNGLDIPEFSTRLGADRNEAMRLLNALQSTNPDQTTRSSIPR
jgi:hypothetical protein